MEKELRGRISNRTFMKGFELAGENSVRAKWVFKLKTNQFGEMTRPKACLVAKGCSQICGVDFYETLDRAPATPSIKPSVAMSLENDLDMFHLGA